jgi:Transposase DDE domain
LARTVLECFRERKPTLEFGANLIVVAPGKHRRHRQGLPKNHLLSGAATDVVERAQRPFTPTPAFLEQRQSEEQGCRPSGEFDADRDIAIVRQRPSQRRPHVADVRRVSRKIMLAEQRLDDLVAFEILGIKDRMAPGDAIGVATLCEFGSGVPHIPVLDKSARDDGTFAREKFAYNQETDIYVCPAGNALTSTGTLVNDGATLLYRASKRDCDVCELKPRCCPKMPARKVPRSIYENARDVARDVAKTETYVTSRRERKKIEMLFAHLKRILRFDRLRLRGPSDAQDEFLLAATAQNLRKLAKLIPLPAPMPA